jgi:hypothetical protein
MRGEGITYDTGFLPKAAFSALANRYGRRGF